jgi:uncharacterized protein involved in outer membrane biogenesis
MDTRNHWTMPQARWALLGLTLTVVLAGAVLIVRHNLRGILVRAIESRSGRTIRIEGGFSAQVFSRHPLLSAEQVTVSNPPWIPAGTTAELGRIVLQLRWRWSVPPLAIERLELEHANLHLLRDAAGHSNWSLREDGAGNGAPLMASLRVQRAHVDLDDQRHHLKFSGTVTAGDLEGVVANPPLRIAGEGELNGRAAAFTIDAEPLAQARRDRPYHFTLEERSASDRLQARGALEHPFDFHVLAGTFEVSGPDMRDVYFLVGLKLLHTGPYRITGELRRHNKRFEYHDLAAATGSSDLGGTLIVDSSSGRPQISGELRSARLRLQDLGRQDAASGPAPTEPDAPGFSAAPLHFAALRKSDWSLQLKAETVELGPAVLHALSAHLRIERGVLSIERLNGQLAAGTASADAHIDARQDIATGDVGVRLADVELQQLDKAQAGAAPLSGNLSGRLELHGSGDSLHGFATTATGRVSAVVPSGSLRAVLAEGASLDLGAALGTLAKSDKQTGIRCAVANFDAKDGILSARTLVLDTDQALITGAGDVQLDSGTVDLTLRGRPKHPRLTLHSAVTVRGTFPHLEYRLNARDVLVQSAAAVALGVVLTPIGAVLAFVNPGLAHNADCAALLAQAQTPAPSPRSDGQGR